MIEQQQTAARGAMVAGAERQCRLDLDGELVWRHARAVMAAMDHEAPGRDGDEIFEGRLDPVLGLNDVKGDVPRHVVAGGDADEVADRSLVRRLGEMHDDVPASGGTFKRRYRRLALEKAFGQEIDDALGGLFAADRKAGTVGGRGEGRIH